MDLLTLMARLGLDSSEYEQGLEGAESKANGFGSKIKAGLGAAAKATAAAVGVAAAGVTALTKSAVDSYSSYEQLIGGVETLFGDSAGRVIEDASNAFRTAGMDMNQYMETSIQSAASLINSLEGDQEKAAELMNVSIVDMSDNVNKMGTTMEAVQNAYRGFSRGNFTMLDNLALGFAGTKEGMQELLDKAHEISGVEFDIDSYSDIVQAIHVVQTEMGITGTTSKEAAGTVSGSAGSMKAAWDNLVIGIATDNADIGSLIDALVSGVETTLGNIMPTVERALSGIGVVIEKLAPVIAEKLPGLLSMIIPSLLSAAFSLVSAFGSALLDNAPIIIQDVLDMILRVVQTLNNPEAINGFINAITSLIDSVLSWIGEYSEVIITAVVSIITTVMEAITAPDNLAILINAVVILIEYLAEALINNVPTLVQAVITIISNLAQVLMDNLPTVISAAIEIINSIAAAIQDNLPVIISAAIEIITSLINGLSEALPTLIGYIPTILNTVVDIITENLPMIIDAGFTLMESLIEGILNNLPAILDAIATIIGRIVSFILENLPEFMQRGMDLINALINGIVDNLPAIVDTIGQLIATIITTLIQNLPEIFMKGSDILVQLIMGLISAIPQLIAALPQIIRAIGQAFVNTDWGEVGRNIISGIGNGIVSSITNLVESARQAAQRVVSGVKNFFGIRSPSKLFRDQVGKMIGLGMAEGIDDSAEEAVDSAQDMARNVFGTVSDAEATMSAGLGLSGSGNGLNGLTPQGSSVIINVYGAEGQNVNELAEVISQKLAFATQQERLAWA